MLAILQQVHEDDHFAIILFDSVIETWKDSLTKATKENITEAMDYIRRMHSRGSKKYKNQVNKTKKQTPNSTKTLIVYAF